MNRITPESVVDAYIATGMYPAFRRWTTRDKKGGCALSTLGYSQGCARKSGSHIEHYARKFDLHRYYVMGFIRGFDRPRSKLGVWWTDNCHSVEAKHYIQGHTDGIAARAAVKAHFAKAKKEKPVETLPGASNEVLEPVAS